MNVTYPLQVLVVEDNLQFRQGILTLLQLFSEQTGHSLKVAAEADALDRALTLLVQLRPYLVLLDLELREGNGIALITRLRELAFDCRVLVLSAHEEDEWIFRAMQAGANGYVFKHRIGTQLFEAITTVLRSETYLPLEVVNGFFRQFQFQEQSSQQSRQRLQLTEREQDILKWLVQGASNDEIAKQLHVTVATVKSHLTSIFEKLQVTSRTQAIVTAFKLGLVQN
ncbi:response regulator transcription factor [Phormidium tenue FACHB-886]|nr:response regulator transcription factor [Phormidium tenue FACHB-886]